MAKFRTVNVDLGSRSYPIYIGENLLNETALFKQHLKYSQVMVVSNETVATLYLKQLLNTLKDFNCDVVLLPEGEKYKNFTTLNEIFNNLLTQHHDRTTTLCALGGGVIGDLTGFAAACYRRGVPYLQLPTTLLAQVDSAIGGKTAINHPLGKNMLGAIYQPNCVIIDVNTLITLPENEFRAGLAEVVKYGLITDANFFSWLENNLPAILKREMSVLLDMIARSCEIKAKIVARDETEQGPRMLLNFGHTFGHALETLTNYEKFLHGEAVALGMIIAADLSHRLGLLNENDLQRIKDLISKIGLSILLLQNYSKQEILACMTFDKKVKDKKLQLILLKGIGDSIITKDFAAEKLNDSLRNYFSE